MRKIQTQKVAIENLINDWNSSLQPLEQFLETNKEMLTKLSIGASLAPEQLEFLGVGLTPEQVVGFIAELGIKEIRFGVRWNHAVDAHGNIDLAYYIPWLDALVEHNIQITLNLGPIKTFRWPEDHVPKIILDQIGNELISIGKTVELDNELAKRSLDYLQELCAQLSKKYPNAFQIIQPENEPNSGFGEHDWRLSDDYLIQAMRICHENFPGSNILLNCPAINGSWEGINNVLLKAQEQMPGLVGNLISAINYYYRHPAARKIGKDTQADTVVAVGEAEIAQQRETLAEYGIRTAVTELQCEPWGEFTTPGNSAHELQFAILRAAYFLNLTAEKHSNMVDIWGLEHLLQMKVQGKWPSEHEEIAHLISKINQL